MYMTFSENFMSNLQIFEIPKLLFPPYILQIMTEENVPYYWEVLVRAEAIICFLFHFNLYDFRQLKRK